MSDRNYFFESMHSVASSVTDTKVTEPVKSDEVSRSFTAAIGRLAKTGDIDLVMRIFKMGQLYGKNVTTNSLLIGLKEVFKAATNTDQITLIDTLAKNIDNTVDCMQQITSVKKDLLIPLILGFALSTFTEIEKNS